MAAYALARERRSTSDGHLGACRGTVFHLWRPLGRLPWNSVPLPVVARALAMEHRSTRRGHRALVMERRSTLDSPRDRAYFHRYEDEDLWVSGFGGCRRYGRAGWHIRSVPVRELSLLLLPRALEVCTHASGQHQPEASARRRLFQPVAASHSSTSRDVTSGLTARTGGMS